MRSTSRFSVVSFVLAVAAGVAALAFARPAAAQCATSGASCLIPHPTPGCNDPACCENVCSSDPSCCTTDWDAACVQNAEVSCIGLCGADISLSCLVPHDTPACDDETCCNTACAIDAFCCDVRWDFACVLFATLNCNIGEPGVCGGPNTGSCYEAHASAACDDAQCCAAVCSISPSCCDLTWDVLCASLAVDVCVGGCQPECPAGSLHEDEQCGQNTNDPCFFPSASPVLLTIPCDGIACGTINVTPSPNGLIKDVDVWRVIATDPNGDGLTSIQISFTSAFVGFAALIPATGCAPLTSALIHVNTSLCIEIPSAPVCVTPGEYYLVIASGTWPALSSSIIDCGYNDGYVVRVFCSDQLCAPPCNPDAGSCYEAHITPGCGDEACCTEVCALDPFCCDINWDGDCAQSAIAHCAVTPANDNCDTAFAIAPGTALLETFAATDGLPIANPICIEGGGSPSANDLWFAYTPNVDGVASVSTCGNAISFDSAIEVYAGSCGNLTLVACDGNGGSSCLPLGAATVFWSTDCGQTYLIRVGGGPGTGTLTLTQINGVACPQCPADLDHSGSVGPSDLAILLGAWGGTGPADLDGNGLVGSTDLAILLGAWGPC